MITGAPITLLVIALAEALLLYYYFKHRFNDEIVSRERTIKNKDDIIELKDATIERIAKQAGVNSKQLSDEQTVKEVRREIQSLERQLQNQQSRQISPEQRQQFRDALRGEHPEIWRVYCVKADSEAESYGKQFMKMFRDCGITINEIPEKDEDRPEFDRHGLVVLVKNVATLAPNALILTKAFDATNIIYHLTQANVERTAPDTYLALRTGPKA